MYCAAKGRIIGIKYIFIISFEELSLSDLEY